MFAVQDAVFNIAYVVAMFVAAAVIDDDGFSVGLIVAGCVLSLVAAFGVWRAEPVVVEGPNQPAVEAEQAQV